MNDFSGRNRSGQQQRERKIREHADANLFFNVLTDEGMLDKLESLLPEHRERLCTPTQTLSLFFAHALNEDRSCQHAVNEWFVARRTVGFSAISTNAAAYCCARQRLPIHLISELVRHSSHELQQRSVRPWKWKGRFVKMVDGTTLLMPGPKENQAKYPQSKTQQPGVGFPLCRLVEILNLFTCGVIDVAFGDCEGKGSGEQGLLRQL